MHTGMTCVVWEWVLTKEGLVSADNTYATPITVRCAATTASIRAVVARINSKESGLGVCVVGTICCVRVRWV